MKVIRDDQDNKVGTVKSNHGCLSAIAVTFGIAMLVALLSGQEGISGVLTGIAFLVIMIAGGIVRAKHKSSTTK